MISSLHIVALRLGGCGLKLLVEYFLRSRSFCRHDSIKSTLWKGFYLFSLLGRKLRFYRLHAGLTTCVIFLCIQVFN